MVDRLAGRVAAQGWWLSRMLSPPLSRVRGRQASNTY
jgi:hypothetical protein